MATCVGIVNISKPELVKEPCEVFGFKSEENIICVAEVTCIVCNGLGDTFSDEVYHDDSPPSDFTVESLVLDDKSSSL